MSAQLRRWARVIILCAAVMTALPSCTFPIFPAANKGTLEVEITYTGSFYHEVFEYAPDAPNVRHVVLVVPDGEESRATAGEIFVNLEVWDALGVITIAPDLAWALDYVYDAPGGEFTGQFEPGRYWVAVAFLAAPVSREEAGVGEDVILYAGITGGGASTDYTGIAIKAGDTVSFKARLTDENGWACPWLYVYDGQAFERRTEILRNLRGQSSAQVETTALGTVPVVDGAVIVRVAEQKDEVSFLDQLTLLVEGVPVRAEGETGPAVQVAALDHDYLILTPGAAHTLRFPLPAALADRTQVAVTVVAAGYYVPVE